MLALPLRELCEHFHRGVQRRIGSRMVWQLPDVLEAKRYRPSLLHQSPSPPVPVPCRSLQQQRRVERGQHISGLLRHSGVLPDELVSRSVRGRFPGVALEDLSTPCSAIAAPVRDRAGGTRQRTDTNRAGTTRYAAAKFSSLMLHFRTGIDLLHGNPAVILDNRTPPKPFLVKADQ